MKQLKEDAVGSSTQYMQPGTYQGDTWLPDEVAHDVVEKLKLRKGDTISKKQIVDALEKQGVSPQRATDVAMSLRNNYGITSTFDEERAMASDLIDELNELIHGDVKPDPEAEFQDVLQEMIAKAKTPEDQACSAALTMISLEDVQHVAMLSHFLVKSDYRRLDECYRSGGLPLVESWAEVRSRPHTARFLAEDVQKQVGEVKAENPLPAPMRYVLGEMAKLVAITDRYLSEKKQPTKGNLFAAMVSNAHRIIEMVSEEE